MVVEHRLLRALMVVGLLWVVLVGRSGIASAQEVGPAVAPVEEKDTWETTINGVFGKYLVQPMSAVFFVDLVFWDNTEIIPLNNDAIGRIGDEDGKAIDLKSLLLMQKQGMTTVEVTSLTQIQLPLLVLWLVLGAIFFTVRMGLINIRGFGHAIAIVRGKYDNPEDVGEVTHFQALTAALSATVGLGNIGGVALAITLGGPGATFWMIAAGFLGMASKFAECTLGQKYRTISPDGTVLGGPMNYLSKGLAELNWPRLGKFLAVFFVILCIGGSFAGGNAYQVNQALEAIEQKFTFLKGNHWMFGLFMSVMVGIVIVGGIKRIAVIAETIVPLMCGIYVAACIYIILKNAGAVPEAMGAIVGGAFTMKAGFGGFIGVLIVGFKRSAFSNEAGVGSAAIAHSAAKTEYPVQEGIVALLEPFVDTIVVCTMTALVIVITGAYANPEWAHLPGAGLTSMAFGSERGISWFPWLLAIAVALFAYSTMISWSYYGERCWTWLFGDNSSMVYRAIFLVFSFLGAIMTGKNVMEFGDLMILGMAFPNILGVVMLSGTVRKDLNDYWAKLKSGEIKPYDGPKSADGLPVTKTP